MRRTSPLVALALWLICGIAAGQTTPPATPQVTMPPEGQPVPGQPETQPAQQPAQTPPEQAAPGAPPNVVAVPLQTIESEESPAWARTLERIASGVVSIQVDEVRAFDTEWNTSAQATGFVVDAKRGLILTNRHVVTPGPVTSQATFLNREEVRLYPVYRHPVHGVEPYFLAVEERGLRGHG